ncbi:MAG: hypothetical protein HYY28_04205 [Betaproteobacteria bacterium]|nr:hypothetical protein [Betaproteobacteria bacterium]MBI2959493.1 hypothetical protein [Betaproteobacteria bacterium]
MANTLACSAFLLLAVPALAAGAPETDKARLLQDAAARVLPAGGHHSRVALGDAVVKLVQAGVLDAQKFEAIYARRGGMPGELKDVLTKPSYEPILLTRANAGVYVNLLWPLGLANRLRANDTSPLNGPSRFNFASTGGWNLGRLPSGGDYFNRFAIVELSPQQEALVVRLARAIYRPCCDNSTFFQDCNHGSALLGLLALGAAQGLGEDELYREAVAFNAFWFPDNYVQTALYFKAVKNLDWAQIDARVLTSAAFSSASGWRKNVANELATRGLVPSQNGPGCSA